MKESSLSSLYSALQQKKQHAPLIGMFELTYRCNLNCIHCYCQDTKPNAAELNTSRWKELIKIVTEEGCIYLTFTGGDPLIRKDFLELYSYARKKGLILSIFTNGMALSKEIIAFLKKHPPYSLEITLNGITKATYESIVKREGAFAAVMENIRRLKKSGIPLILKSNLLKQNKDEVCAIKAFADKLLGKAKGAYRFKYDPMLYPRLNGDTTPCQYRLSFEELESMRRNDLDIWQEYQRQISLEMPDLGREKRFLYRCNSWMQKFIINPYGRLKFCHFSEKFSVDLKKTSFREGFYNVFPLLLNETFKTSSRCQRCRLRSLCYHCPARAYLETGDEEGPVEYYCTLAKKMFKRKEEEARKP